MEAVLGGCFCGFPGGRADRACQGAEMSCCFPGPSQLPLLLTPSHLPRGIPSLPRCSSNGEPQFRFFILSNFFWLFGLGGGFCSLSVF